MKRRIVHYCIACGLPLPPSGLCRRYECREEAKRVEAALSNEGEEQSPSEGEDIV